MQRQIGSSFRELPHVIGHDGNKFRYMQVTEHPQLDLYEITQHTERRRFRKEFRKYVPQLTFGNEVDLSGGFLTPTGEFKWSRWEIESARKHAYETALLALPTEPHVVGARMRLVRLAHESRLAEYAQEVERDARGMMPLYLIAQGPNEMRFGSACILPVCIAAASERYPIVESGIFIDEGFNAKVSETDLRGSVYQVNGATQGAPYVRMRLQKAEVIPLPVQERTASRVA